MRRRGVAATLTLRPAGPGVYDEVMDLYLLRHFDLILSSLLTRAKQPAEIVPQLE